MPIQNVDAATIQGAVRQDYGDAALGRVGNMAFRGSPGATPRVHRPNVFQRIATNLSAAIAYIRHTPQQRAQTQAIAAAREISQDAGSLLGALTNASAKDGKRAAASALQRLLVNAEKLSTGGTSAELLAPALQRHARAFGDMDMLALRKGGFFNEDVQGGLISELPPSARDAAAEILELVQRTITEEHAVRGVARFCATLHTVADGPDTVDSMAIDNALHKLDNAITASNGSEDPGPDLMALGMSRQPADQLAGLVRALSLRDQGGGACAFEGIAAELSYLTTRSLDKVRQAAIDEAIIRLDREVERQSALIQSGIARERPAQMLYDAAQRAWSAQVEILGGKDLPLPDAQSKTVVPRALAAAGGDVANRFISQLDYKRLAALRADAATLGDAQIAVLDPAIERAYDVLADRVDAAVAQALADLDAAVSHGNRGFAAQALRALSGAADDARLFHGKFGQTIDGPMQNALRETVGNAQALFRAADDGNGPLSLASLAELTDRELGHLAAAGDELAGFGLDIDARAMTTEVARRGDVLMRPVQQAIVDLMQLLASNAEIGNLMPAVRDLAGQVAGGMDKLSVFGTGMDGNDRTRVLDSILENAVSRIADNEVLRNAARNINTQLGSATNALQEMKMALASHMGFQDAQVDAVREHVVDVSASQYALLDAASGSLVALAGMLIRAAGMPEEAQAPAIASPDLLALLRMEFGMDYEPVSGDAVMTLADAPREQLNADLARPASEDTWPNQTVDLSDGTRTRSFTVSQQFVADAIDRSSVTFSVSGQDEHNRPVNVALLRNPLAGTSRENAMAQSLDALQRVAGGASERLTRIMNQQIAGALLTGLDTIGTDSPLQLPDGTTVIPTGAGQIHFDVEGLADGRFAIDVHMHIPRLKLASIQLPDGERDGVRLDPANSDVKVTFGLLVAANVETAEVAKPVQMRYRFSPA